MRIVDLRLYPVAVSRQYGTVIAMEGGEAKRTVEESFFYFVELTADNGLKGWGEISDIDPQDLPKHDEEYRSLLADFTLGRSPWSLARLHREFREHFDTENNSLAHYAECALDMACYDLQGKAAGRRVCDLLGGAVRREVEISWVAFIREDLAALRDEIREKMTAGFRAFKLKVGVDIDLDEARLAALREVAGPEASVKIDANEGWSVEEAPKHIRRLNRYNLAGVETPVPRENPADIAAVRRQVDVPIIEHVHTLEYGLSLVKAEAVDYFNLATTGCGGLWPAVRVATLAESAGLGVLLGSTVEMGPGTLAQLHLAAVVAPLNLPSDLVGPGLYRSDVLPSPLKYRSGKLSIPTGPGLGAAPDKKLLASLRTNR